MIGETNEATIEINNISTKALLDTGSCVSVVSDSFYKEHVGSCQLNPITSMFHIECPDGQELPYSGFIEADLSIRQGLPKA